MIRVLLYGCLILFCISSCHFFDSPSSDAKPIRFERFDLDMEAFDLKNFESSDQKMQEKYGDLYTFYIENIMGLGAQKDKKNPQYYDKVLPEFLNGENKALMDSFRKRIFDRIPQFEQELGNSYAALQKEFPEKKPSIIYSFFISPMAHNSSAAFSFGLDTIGINWFNYMGENFSLYQGVYEGYTYMVKWNNPEYLVRNVMLVEYNLIREKFSPKEKSDELIYQMIEEGKKFYFLDKVCPDTKDWTKIGYTEEQSKWCQDNELEVWGYFTSNKLLNSIETMDAKRYTSDGPTTGGMPSESPGNVGSWVGWQIVKAYADKTNKSLKEILTTSPKEILTKANYKPKK
jgi:hypothetical protein